LIRNNINFLCVFRQSSKYTKDVYDDYAVSDFTLKRFKEICNSCWSEKCGFLTIDTDKDLNEGQYRKKFKEQINT
jgi:hypothetical protein